jgi:hypothetical protein
LLSNISANLVIYLFIKLRHLLHNRIDPTVNSLRKKISEDRKKKQNNQRSNQNQSSPPIDAPNWCLSIEALEELGLLTDNIPNYDPESDNNIEEYNDDEKSDDNGIYGKRSDDNKISESPKRKKRKNKSHKQKKKGNNHKTKKLKTKRS